MNRHPWLVRWTHALHALLLLGLVVSGLAIFWASPFYRLPGWVYRWFSLGPYHLAAGLGLHWLCAYALMANGLVYAMVLAWSGRWLALMPSKADARDVPAMIRYYLRLGPHRPSDGYNALQRWTYLLVLAAGIMAIWSGWALHKPNTLPWLAAPLGGYEQARLWHFWTMVFLVAFTLVHVVLAARTTRSMVVAPEASRRRFVAVLASGAVVLWLPAGPFRERLMNAAMRWDDAVGEALFSPRMVPTYDRSQATPNLRNNYLGRTPDPSYLAGWSLDFEGRHLELSDLANLPFVEQVTRLVCVEGWSAIVWWGGYRLADFLAAWPPPPEARWLRLESSVNLDGGGHPDPYYVAIDLATARHPQSLLATHYHGAPLTVEHGAPLRLVAPTRLGLKNIKAVTSIRYSVEEPGDYWNERGYSRDDEV